MKNPMEHQTVHPKKLNEVIRIQLILFLMRNILLGRLISFPSQLLKNYFLVVVEGAEKVEKVTKKESPIIKKRREVVDKYISKINYIFI
jgi:hypothetical protein